MDGLPQRINGIRELHEFAHLDAEDLPDDPGLFVMVSGPELALIVLGLTLVGDAFPCLDEKRLAFEARIDELIDVQINDTTPETEGGSSCSQ